MNAVICSGALSPRENMARRSSPEETSIGARSELTVLEQANDTDKMGEASHAFHIPSILALADGGGRGKSSSPLLATLQAASILSKEVISEPNGEDS